MKYKLQIFKEPTIFSDMNYKKCNVVDAIINSKLDVGIKDLQISHYFIWLKFKDGVESRLWNANKYHAWLCNGYVGNHKWNGVRPSKATMRRLNDCISKHIFK